MAADGEGAGPDEHLLTHPLVLAVIKDLKDMLALLRIRSTHRSCRRRHCMLVATGDGKEDAAKAVRSACPIDTDDEKRKARFKIGSCWKGSRVWFQRPNLQKTPGAGGGGDDDGARERAD